TTLFPNPLVHVGGDEVPVKRWEESPVAQGVVASAGLKGTADIETWFIGRIAASLAARGRQLLGWDEIAGGAKIANATVMSWRGADTGRDAAEKGYPVIM